MEDVKNAAAQAFVTNDTTELQEFASCFKKMSPIERVRFFSYAAKSLSSDEIKILHPFIADEICAAFGVPTGPTGKNVKPQMNGYQSLDDVNVTLKQLTDDDIDAAILRCSRAVK